MQLRYEDCVLAQEVLIQFQQTARIGTTYGSNNLQELGTELLVETEIFEQQELG